MAVLLLALAPVFIILFYVYFRDRYEKEPFKLLALAILAGIIIVAPVIFIERLIIALQPPMGQLMSAGYQAFMVASLVEEGFKYLALFLLIWKSSEFNEKFDGIVYAVFISLGFAAVENILYVMEGGIRTGLLRAITAVPAHALFGVTMGYYFGIARMYVELRKAYMWRAFLIPFLLHGIYDFLLMSNLPILLLAFIPFMFYLYFTGFRKMKITSDSSVFKDADVDEE